MISQSKIIHDASKLSAAIRGHGITKPNRLTDGIVSPVYSGERNFPMMGGDWLFSLEALSLTGKAMFGDEWDGSEFESIAWPISPMKAHTSQLLQQRLVVQTRKYVPQSLADHYSTPHEALSAFQSRKAEDLEALTKSETDLPATVAAIEKEWEANKSALNRLTKAAKWLGDLCRNELIKTGYGAVANLPILSGQSYSWNCISDIHHWVNDGSLEIFMAGTGKMHRCKAYVSRSDLEREIRTLAHSASIVSETDLSRLPPYLKFAVNMALAQNWLIDGRQDSGPVREAEIAAKWPDAFPHIELSDAAKRAISKVLGVPDAEAINRSVKAAAKEEKK